jgi:hypothetical protein
MAIGAAVLVLAALAMTSVRVDDQDGRNEAA